MNRSFALDQPFPSWKISPNFFFAISESHQSFLVSSGADRMLIIILERIDNTIGAALLGLSTASIHRIHHPKSHHLSRRHFYARCRSAKSLNKGDFSLGNSVFGHIGNKWFLRSIAVLDSTVSQHCKLAKGTQRSTLKIPYHTTIHPDHAHHIISSRSHCADNTTSLDWCSRSTAL